MNNFNHYTNQLLTLLSYYLNTNPCLITPSQIKKVTKCGVSTKDAYKLLLTEYLEITDSFLVHEYINKMIYEEKQSDYTTNPYFKNIHFDNIKLGKWKLKNTYYKPFELFVRDDFLYKDEKVIPQLGYFVEPFYFPAIYENNVLWMSITPNEINTMREPINEAFGNVVTFGLGLGYYAYMVSIKDNVNSITIIEKDKNAITLFKNCILPQFSHPEKIKIIEIDAYEYYNNMNDDTYDYVFVDIYHDASDGMDVFNKFQETKDRFIKTTFSYWIEKTIKYYIK